MPARQPLSDALRDLISAQAGAVSAEQCRVGGLSRRQLTGWVAQGQWQRVAPGLYLAQAGPPSVEARRWLAILAAGPRAALGFETAAAIQGWGKHPELVELVVPAEQRGVQPGEWSVSRTRVPFRTRGAPPMTTPERTALDLVRREPDQAVAVLTSVVNARRTTAKRILGELEAFATFPRRDFVRGVLGDVGEGALSVLEAMWLREVERAHGLPRGERQTRSRVGLRDIRYGRLLVELDGKLGHVGTGAFRDMFRDNHHLLAGEPTLRYGFHDIDRRPCACAAQVAAAIRILGQPLDPVSCHRGCVESEALLDRS